MPFLLVLFNGVLCPSSLHFYLTSISIEYEIRGNATSAWSRTSLFRILISGQHQVSFQVLNFSLLAFLQFTCFPVFVPDLFLVFSTGLIGYF